MNYFSEEIWKHQRKNNNNEKFRGKKVIFEKNCSFFFIFSRALDLLPPNCTLFLFFNNTYIINLMAVPISYYYYY